jgi:hypothetical protein
MNNAQPVFAVLDKHSVVINVVLAEGEPLFDQDSQSYQPALNYILCNAPESLNVNEPAIGYNFVEDLNAFIPSQPDPTYLLNTSTYLWEPDPSLEYDLHGDGKLYRYDPVEACWIPLFGPS